MKEEVIKQVFDYLNNNYSYLYIPSSFQKRKNFVCQIKDNYWFLAVNQNMFSFIRENPVSQAKEEFKFNSSTQLKVAINKDFDIEKVLACIVVRLNYLSFLKTNVVRDKGTNLEKVFSKINDYYIENTFLHQNLIIEENTRTIRLADPIFSPLQTHYATIRPELRQSNYMTREEIDEFFSRRINESVNRLADQAQRTGTIRVNNDVTMQIIREQLEQLSERVEVMRASVERNNNE